MRPEIRVCGRMPRRRFIAITAGVMAGSLLPGLARAEQLRTFRWQGVVLGADASLSLQHEDEAEAKSAIADCLAEAARLEAIFSLFRPDSALARLNAEGRLSDTPMDLRVLLGEALVLAERSAGAFDPTIQPLWALYADHFARPDAAPEGPSPTAIAAAKRLVDWRRVKIAGGAVRLAEPGMALTLNGIAQGYITDRVGDLLRARGFSHVLVDLGEELALGPKSDGAPWRIGIADPERPSVSLTDLDVTEGAVATSGGYGYRFDPAGRFTHILDPDNGKPAHRWASVTVLAESAMLADGLSTALSVMPVERAADLIDGRARVYVVPEGARRGRWL
jgi:thiamine biosynthesis lipoprotein